MNIKRAFLTLAALMLIPGFAMAQTSFTINTTVEYLPLPGPNTGPVQVDLICNSGDDLTQDFEVGPTTDDDVTFNVNNFSDVSGNYCEVYLGDTESGWEVYRVVNNNVQNLDRGYCRFISTEDSQGDGNGRHVDWNGGELTCEFELIPAEIEYTINKEWDFNGVDPDDVSEFARVDVVCRDVIVGDEFPEGDWYIGQRNWFGIPISEDSPVVATGVRVHPLGDGDDYSRCYAMEETFDSAVESDGGCSGFTYFSLDSLEGSCTITNTVFFEGIPTLSQYGMAIMALLMLGVGFVGFRRFV